MTKKAAKTGADPTGLVAIEQKLFSENARIINDELAYKILPFSIKVAIWWKTTFFSDEDILKCADKEFPGLWNSIMCRKRYIDERVIDATDRQIEAIVNLGAGFDTRAYRLPALAKIPIWELDQPMIINSKQSRLKKLFKKIPDHVTLVSIDFNYEELGAVLKSHGYATNKKTFFIWEAVTQYLTDAAIKTIFNFLAKTTTYSRLVFTYVCKDFINGNISYGLENKFVIRNSDWLFGIDPSNIDDFLGKYGWHVLEHLGYEAFTERYVKPTGRELEPMLLERIVYAEKLKTKN